MKFRARALLLQSLGARAAVDLGWRFWPGMRCEVEGNTDSSHGHRASPKGSAALHPGSSSPNGVGGGGGGGAAALFSQSRRRGSGSGETLPSSGLRPGDPSEEATANLVWVISQTGIKWGR